MRAQQLPKIPAIMTPMCAATRRNLALALILAAIGAIMATPRRVPRLRMPQLGGEAQTPQDAPKLWVGTHGEEPAS